jgi:hypothetical protein
MNFRAQIYPWDEDVGRAYKARLSGVTVIAVDPRNTS